MSEPVYLVLDIDGVLNTSNTVSDNLTQQSIDTLIQLQQTHNYIPIISSTWRLQQDTKHIIQQTLLHNKIGHSTDTILYTVDLHGMGTRCDEIVETLKLLCTQHNTFKLVILDDTDILISESNDIRNALRQHTVLIDGNVGLTCNDITRIHNALQYSISEDKKSTIQQHEYMKPKMLHNKYSKQNSINRDMFKK